MYRVARPFPELTKSFTFKCPDCSSCYVCVSGSAMSTLGEVQITPCPQQPCVLKKGSEGTVEVTFTPSTNSFFWYQDPTTPSPRVKLPSFSPTQRPPTVRYDWSRVPILYRFPSSRFLSHAFLFSLSLLFTNRGLCGGDKSPRQKLNSDIFLYQKLFEMNLFNGFWSLTDNCFLLSFFTFNSTSDIT